MIKASSDQMLSRHIRLDIATVCQLKCPACPTASGETGKRLGTGFLKLADFKKVIDENPWLCAIELSNWGEIFLNKDLPEMLRYAYKRNVALHAVNGVNLNTVKEETLEALVKYKLRGMTCSIDGASQETYIKYRVNGNFDTVIANVRRINYYKAKYRTPYPKLRWQYVAFGHNEHEIAKARQMAQELNMEFYLKLSWDDLYTKEYSPVRDKETVRKETGLGVASREEHRQLYGSEYVERKCCLEIWKYPQINIDGRVLGCSVNYWADFGNAFTGGLKKALTSESLSYARAMLMGKAPAKEGIACTTCKIYHRMKKSGQWATQEETAMPHTPSRLEVMLENKILGVRLTRVSKRLYGYARHPLRTAKGVRRRALGVVNAAAAVLTPQKKTVTPSLSGVYPLTIAQESDVSKKWRAYPKFSGASGVSQSFSCHSSVLAPGHCPHPPHEHRDEEILMMLSGEARLILPALDTNGPHETVLGPGQFVYYPAGFLHTLKASNAGAANYLMFKWFAEAASRDKALGYGIYDPQENFRKTSIGGGFNTRVLFEGPTANLSKLHGHTTTLLPGGGYEVHRDPYDVAIVVLEGCVETLGRRVEPHGVIFYSAGEPHGMRNPGAKPAKYVVFEFHA